jgi:hypothetical protein
MNPIQDAIDDIELQPSGAQFSYPQVAKKFDVHPETLRRRYQGSQTTYAGGATKR